MQEFTTLWHGFSINIPNWGSIESLRAFFNTTLYVLKSILQTYYTPFVRFLYLQNLSMQGIPHTCTQQKKMKAKLLKHHVKFITFFL